LNLVVDGQKIAIPQDIGQVVQGSAGIVDPASREVGCNYPLITTDTSGKIRTKPGSAAPYTLGQFFALWGQPLSTTNVAGYAGKPVKVFIRDGRTLTEYTGALDALPLTGNREITIQVGSAISEIPNYEWKNPPALSAKPLMVNRGAFGTALIGQGGLEDNLSNGRGSMACPAMDRETRPPLSISITPMPIWRSTRTVFGWPFPSTSVSSGTTRSTAQLAFIRCTRMIPPARFTLNRTTTTG
jgi:hypothetical protein